MIILDFFRDNIFGNIQQIKLKSFSTGYTFLTEYENEIQTKDLIVEPFIGLV